jgi:hypothetical protein
MKRRRPGPLVLLLVVGTLVASCASEPGAGELVVMLESVADDDGAVVIEVRGGPIQDPQAVHPEHLFFARQPDELTLTVALVGDIERGDLFTFRIPDADLAAVYRVTLREVADRQNRLRSPPYDRYRVSTQRVGE